MGLLNTLGVLGSSINATSAQIALVSRNISNAGAPGYARKSIELSFTTFGGVQTGAIGRATNDALTEQVNRSTSQASSASVISDALAALSASADPASTTGSSGSSPGTALSAFRNALETYFAAPDSAASSAAAVDAAKNVARSLNEGAQTVDRLTSRADAQTGATVGDINSLLEKFGEANRSVVAGLKTNSDVSDAMDSRDDILRRLSTDIGISTIGNADGSVSIYTDSGVTLFQDRPRTVAFDAAASKSVTIDGIPVTGKGAPMTLRSGALAGQAQVRDVLAPQYQAQLDQMANALVTGFQEKDQSAAPSLPALPGLFTFQGANGMPQPGDVPGLAARLVVNQNVDPEKGGNPALLRDGAISVPGNAAYTYNSSGAASFTGRIQAMLKELDQPRSFDPGAGIPSGVSISGYSDGSISWVQSRYMDASALAEARGSVATQATAALSNATGVNLDAELNHMLSLENSYGATAKLLSTVQTMFSTLMSAVGR